MADVSQATSALRLPTLLRPSSQSDLLPDLTSPKFWRTRFGNQKTPRTSADVIVWGSEEEPAKPQLEEPRAAQAGIGADVKPASEKTLTKEQALQLQAELMASFNQPRFQQNLHELGREHGSGSRSFRSELLKLVRSKQVELIPLYGFEGSEAGVEQMLRAFSAWDADPDVQVNNMAIKDLLCIEITEPTLCEKRAVIERPSTKHRILDLLRVQLIEFSKATFQAEIDALKREADGGPKPAKDTGYYQLPGRADLALVIQQVLLPQYGFSPGRDGVQEMLSHCAPHIHDPEVAELVDRLNEKLGMSADACRRFRTKLALLA